MSNVIHAINELEQEVQRLRKALKDIADLGDGEVVIGGRVITSQMIAKKAIGEYREVDFPEPPRFKRGG